MTDLSVSVVVVSRGRPDALTRCLLGLSQLQYPNFEIIVVADPEGITAAQGIDFAQSLKLMSYDEANISAARNIGIANAAGEVIAFIDDDAVPEPQWLRYLVAPAQQSEVAAMGGFVRGRNGISFQWKARSLDRYGDAKPIEIDHKNATILHPPQGSAVKVEGTNMAFRRSVLIQLGGFDEAFHYYLDETDLNMRLARAGHATALVPLAEVHHGFAANALRKSNRVPRDLYDIGASWAVFQRKHVPVGERAAHWQSLRHHERQRVLRHMVSGGLEPRDVRQLLQRLDLGYADGQDRPLTTGRLAAHPSAPFMPFPSQVRRSVWMASRPSSWTTDVEKAGEKVKNGEIVTIYCLSSSAFYHSVSFDANGIWVQRGGVYGKSIRNGPVFRVTTRAGRIRQEVARVASQRGLEDR